MNSTETKQVQDEELQAAQNTIQAFIAAFKSYLLYPEGHVFNQTNLKKFTSQLETFLAQYNECSFSIEKNTFLYEGEKIFEGPTEENNPAYLMTRDGVVRLNFLRGIDLSEIQTLLSILNRNRGGGDESGGDIVTALWQEELEHIEYEEVDIFALESFAFDLGALKVEPDDTPMDSAEVDMPADQVQAGAQKEAVRSLAETTGIETAQNQPLVQSETVSNLLRMEGSLEVLEITPEEKLLLQAYVEEEEQKDYTNDIIDVLLIILISQKKKQHFGQVLEFLEAVFFDSLNRGEFHLAYKLCSNVLTIRNQIKGIRPWTLDMVNNFISSLSAEGPWADLSWFRDAHLLVLYRRHIKFLFHVLRLLTPDIIFTLGPLMGKIEMDNIHVRNELFELIESKSKKNPDKLNSLLSRSDENINLLLFPIVEHLDGMDAAKISLQMTHHGSVEVRRTGLNGYFSSMASPDLEGLYPLLHDEDDVIVGKVLTFLLSQAEKEQAEAMLLRFLKQATAGGVERAHMFEYYKALSQCGSFRSVNVLKKILLESNLTEMFSNMNAVHKKGSALALKILGTEEALIVLRKGARSMRPDVRLACQFALEKVE